MTDFMRWPEPGVLPKINRQEIPVGSTILGLAPIGIRWMATMTKNGIKPEGNCPRSEFVPCFCTTNNGIKEVA